MKKITVTIDISPLKNTNRFRGVGFYTKNLTESLQRIVKENKKYSNFEIKLTDKPFSNSVIQQLSLVHYPYFDIFFPTLPKRETLTAVTVHDLTPLVFPDQHPSRIKGKINWAKQRKRLQKVEAIITDSQNSKEDIVRLVNYPPERVFVIHLGVGKSFKKIKNEKIKLKIKNKYCLPKKFVFYVGDVNWNKNVPGLVKACRKNNIPLVIAGKQAVNQNYDRNHFENQDLVWLQKESQKNPDIHLLGFVQDEDLPVIYNLATLYCQPSFYEGFGMTVLEAMACGCPVVSSNTGSLPEIGEDAVLYCNPNQPKSIIQSIEAVVYDNNLACKLSERGLVQVKKFSWEKCARETLEVYQAICS
ncbi:MAG: glycosyltransferase family 1 protein [Candidatus Shapirobacteria bacterium]|nr:glycosyltransferase family 1 protein [Candidatus Shapirobacteria bacterium]